MQWRVLPTGITGAIALAACTDDVTRPSAAGSMAAHHDLVPEFVLLREIGHPIWEPTDFHLFTAPLGTEENEFAGFGALVEALWPSPDHVPVSPTLGIGPGSAHGPPYRHELFKALKEEGLEDRDVFPAVAFASRPGNAIYLAGTLVARDVARGRSPDFESGWIIPNRVMPINVVGIAERNGEIFDPILAPESDLPALDENIGPRFADMDGHSHIPFITGTSQTFGPPGTPARGRYRYEVRMRDRAGNGWNIVARFQVRQNR